MTIHPFGLFEAFGIELEYMLVDSETLDVRPVADEVLSLMAGKPTGDVEIGPITWSNELALHVIELKTTQPAKRLRPLPSQFETAIEDLLKAIKPKGLCLLPTAVHPWMIPATDARLWPHEYHEVYETYDRIFNCRTHGWSNVQSVHLNLPFANDQEFARLHAAARLILPLLPGLTASSPVLEGRYTGQLDTRMSLYANHCAAVPSLTGQLIPEPIYTETEYRRQIFDRIAQDIAPHDPQHVMHVDFLNARGAIARFDRGSIELRVMDVQEYPGADVAICAAVISLLRAMCQETWSTCEAQQQMGTDELRSILDQTTRLAENAVVSNSAFLSHFGIDKSKIRVKRIWQQILDKLRRDDRTLDNLFAPLEIILEHGTLASRIHTALGDELTGTSLLDVYRDLSECLTRWHPFQP